MRREADPLAVHFEGFPPRPLVEPLPSDLVERMNPEPHELRRHARQNVGIAPELKEAVQADFPRGHIDIAFSVESGQPGRERLKFLRICSAGPIRRTSCLASPAGRIRARPRRRTRGRPKRGFLAASPADADVLFRETGWQRPAGCRKTRGFSARLRSRAAVRTTPWRPSATPCSRRCGTRVWGNASGSTGDASNSRCRIWGNRTAARSSAGPPRLWHERSRRRFGNRDGRRCSRRETRRRCGRRQSADRGWRRPIDRIAFRKPRLRGG